MHTEGRDTHGGAGNWQIGHAHDLTDFPNHLHFFACIAIGLEAIDLRNNVEGQRVAKHLMPRLHPIHQHAAGFAFQLRHAFRPGARGRLIGGNNHALQAESLAQWLQSHHQDGRGAIGVGDQLGLADGAGIHFRHHQRHIILQAKGRGIIHHMHARRHHGRRMGLGKIAGDREQRQIKVTHGGIAEGLDLRLTQRGFDLSAGAAGRGKQPERGHREGPTPQNIHQFAAHRTGGPNHADTHCNFPVVKLGRGRFNAESTKMEQAERGGPRLLPAPCL